MAPPALPSLARWLIGEDMNDAFASSSFGGDRLRRCADRPRDRRAVLRAVRTGPRGGRRSLSSLERLVPSVIDGLKDCGSHERAVTSLREAVAHRREAQAILSSDRN